MHVVKLKMSTTLWITMNNYSNSNYSLESWHTCSERTWVRIPNAASWVIATGKCFSSTPDVHWLVKEYIYNMEKYSVKVYYKYYQPVKVSEGGTYLLTWRHLINKQIAKCNKVKVNTCKTIFMLFLETSIHSTTRKTGLDTQYTWYSSCLFSGGSGDQGQRYRQRMGNKIRERILEISSII